MLTIGWKIGIRARDGDIVVNSIARGDIAGDGQILR